MPHTRCKEVYYFDELSDSAKETARSWYREGAFDYNWWDCIYDDTVRIAKLLGIMIKAKNQPCTGGYTEGKWNPNKEWVATSPAIYFSGFWSQGDGACFEGTWQARDMKPLKDLKGYAPQDKELHRIHKALWAIKKQFPDASCTSKHTGHYYHSRSCTLDPLLAEDRDYNKEEWEPLEEALIDFMDWIYGQLEKEYDYLNSDEQVDETIRANEYEFTEEGDRVR